MIRRATWLGVLVLMTAFGTSRVRADSIILPRAGQIGIGLQGGYGVLTDSGNEGSLFSDGPTFAVRIRYRMRSERGIGLSFESQRLDARQAPPIFVVGDESTVAPSKLSLVASGAEFYQMFDTQSKTVKMIMVGGGLAQMRADLNTGETSLAGNGSGDGLYVSGGFGIERFFFRSWAWDFSLRYMAVFLDGKANHDLQSALGLIFYTGS